MSHNNLKKEQKLKHNKKEFLLVQSILDLLLHFLCLSSFDSFFFFWERDKRVKSFIIYMVKFTWEQAIFVTPVRPTFFTWNFTPKYYEGKRNSIFGGGIRRWRMCDKGGGMKAEVLLNSCNLCICLRGSCVCLISF